jgi:hypothetical protein
MVGFFSVLSILGALLAGFGFVVGLSQSLSAPQSAAWNAGVLVVAIVPYVLMRSIAALKHASQMSDVLKVLRSYSGNKPSE